MARPLIHFRCASEPHAKGSPPETADTLTVHEGKWAYCPFDVRASGHRWETTGGVPLERLVPMGRHGTRRTEPSPQRSAAAPAKSEPPRTARSPRRRT